MVQMVAVLPTTSFHSSNAILSNSSLFSSLLLPLSSTGTGACVVQIRTGVITISIALIWSSTAGNCFDLPAKMDCLRSLEIEKQLQMNKASFCWLDQMTSTSKHLNLLLFTVSVLFFLQIKPASD